jgi:hypothetical protein
LGGDENAQKRGLREDFMKEEKKKSDIWGWKGPVLKAKWSNSIFMEMEAMK